MNLSKQLLSDEHIKQIACYCSSGIILDNDQIKTVNDFFNNIDDDAADKLLMDCFINLSLRLCIAGDIIKNQDDVKFQTDFSIKTWKSHIPDEFEPRRNLLINYYMEALKLMEEKNISPCLH